MIQKSNMRSILLPPDLDTRDWTTGRLARASGLAWGTVDSVLRGTGTIASLERVRLALGLTWSWSQDAGPAVGTALALKRKSKQISQREMARKLDVSPQTVVSLEKTFIGRIDLLRRYLRQLRVTEVFASSAKRLVPDRNAPEADVVYTPNDLAARIIADFANDISGKVLDPARGGGAFYDALPDTVEAHWCEASEGRDFYDWTMPVDWIVTNPPWSEFRDFLRHSMAVADNVLFLAPLTHYTTKSRITLIQRAGFGLRRIHLVPSPKDWPSSGFQLAAVWLKKGWHGEVVSRIDP